MTTNLGGAEFFLILLATVPVLLVVGWLVLTVFRLRARVEDLQRRMDSIGQSSHLQGK